MAGNRRIRALAAILLALAAGPVGCGDTDLSSPVVAEDGPCSTYRSRLLPAGAHAIKRATGDFDGDGRPDAFMVYDPTSGDEEVVEDEPGVRYDSGPWRLRMELSNGAVSEDALTHIDNKPRLLGVVDVNGDGRDEVLLRTGGETVSSGGIMTLDGCQVAEVHEPNGLAYAFAYEPHSMGAPGSEVGFACVDVDGDGRVDPVATAQDPIIPDVDGDGRAGTPQDFHEALVGSLAMSWSYTAYRLEGAVLRPFQHGRGESTTSSPPDAIPFGIDVQCGSGDALTEQGPSHPTSSQTPW